MKTNDFLNEMRIASPCPVGWEQMSGDERVRHCRLCDLHVYNISELTPKQVQSLIEHSDGRICARLFRRADGTVITRDCPVGLRAVRRRVAKTAAAVFTAILSLSAMVLGQKPAKVDKNSCVPQVQITRKISDTDQAGRISLQVFDVNGAVVAGADVMLLETGTTPPGVMRTTNDEGRVEFPEITQGTYDLTIMQPGFKKFLFRKLAVNAKELVGMNVTLTVASDTGTVGVLLFEPYPLNRPIGTTIITREMIDRLPHQN
jgi:Carboxypeptidase regulatory-like domain